MNDSPEAELIIDRGTTDDEEDTSIYKSISNGPELRKFVEKPNNFINKVKKKYKHNPLLSKIMNEPEHYKTFRFHDSLIYSTNCGNDEVLCIPRHITREYSLTGIIIEQAHTVLGHFGPQKTGNYIRC